MAEFGTLVALPFRMFTEITEGQREGGRDFERGEEIE
jgi:hypothetical protein